jgi:hypothetical protein
MFAVNLLESGRFFNPRPMSDVAVLQLPIPDPDPSRASANVPLAAGYLKACAPPGQREAIRILPRELSRYGGDQAILAWLVGRKPGTPAREPATAAREPATAARQPVALAAFTCYGWNLERSLWLARRLKELDPSARVACGGPEIVSGRPLLANEAVDAFVQGEGEPVFPGLLEALRAGRRLPRFTAAPLARLEEVPNPYLAGVLEAGPEDPLYLETLRGCPHRCSYCFYGKQFPSVRRFPEPVLAEAFALAREQRVPEIYLMDPSFTSSRGLPERLERLASLNRTGIRLHTELRLEAVGPETARALRRAGFVSVEAGLQSVNPEALRAVHRSFDREAFQRGAQALLAQGIRVRTGIILGLPGDTLEGFSATLRFLAENGLAEEAEVYPLAVLPGTELRERAGELRLEYMSLPPYWVLRTPLLTEADLFRGVRMAEDSLEGELFAPIVPCFGDPAAGLTGFLDLRAGTPAAALDSLRRQEALGASPAAANLASSVTVLVSAAQLTVPAQLDELTRLGERLLAANPFGLYQLVIEGPEVPRPEPANRLAEAFYNPGQYFDRSRYYQEDPQGRFSSRLFHLTSDPGTARRYLGQAMPCELILSYSPRLLRSARELLEEHPLLLVDRALSREERRELRAIYRRRENLLIRRGPIPRGLS